MDMGTDLIDDELLLASATNTISIRSMYTQYWKSRQQPPTRFFTYVLLLQHGKIYVGSTDNIYVRLTDHFTCSSSSAAWVREYGPPERIVEIVIGGPADTESYLYCLYADRFGYTNVRGGSVCKLMVDHEPAVVRTFQPDDRQMRRLSRADITRVQAKVEQLIKISRRNLVQ